MVVDALDDLLAVDFELLGAAGEVLVDAGLGKRVGDLDDHGAVAAGRVEEVARGVPPVVLGSQVHPVLPDREHGTLPGLGQVLPRTTRSGICPGRDSGFRARAAMRNSLLTSRSNG